MKIYENGTVREMTPEEIEQINASIPEEVKETAEERLEKLEKLFTKIADFLGVK